MLYVICPKNTLTDFIFSELKKADWVKVIEHPLPRRNIARTLLKSLEVYLLPGLRRTFCFDREYVAQLKLIGAKDTVLLFSIENRKDLQITLKFIAAQDVHQWIWNPVGSFRKSRLSRSIYKHWLARRGIQSSTFDPADALQFGFVQRPQVLRRVATKTQQTTRHDVYFVGNDKGRLEMLKEWQSRFEQVGLSTHFHIVADKKRRYTAQDRTRLANEWLPYADNIELVQQSRCLLELLQSTQSGPTMRSLEAAFFAKKLITNNKSIRHTALYSPNRIFIIGEDNPLALRAFIDSVQDPVPESILAQHDIEGWIKSFLTTASNRSDTPALQPA